MILYLQKSTNAVVDLPKDDAVLVGRMISFFHRGGYEDFDKHRYVNHAGGFVLAVKYGVSKLQDLACVSYWRTCQKEWDVFGFLDAMPGIYQDMHESVRELRGYAQRCAWVHIQDLTGDEISRARWRQLCLDIPYFIFDVLTYFPETPAPGYCHSCDLHQKLESLQYRCKRCGKGGAHRI